MMTQVPHPLTTQSLRLLQKRCIQTVEFAITAGEITIISPQPTTLIISTHPRLVAQVLAPWNSNLDKENRPPKSVITPRIDRIMKDKLISIRKLSVAQLNDWRSLSRLLDSQREFISSQGEIFYPERTTRGVLYGSPQDLETMLDTYQNAGMQDELLRIWNNNNLKFLYVNYSERRYVRTSHWLQTWAAE